MKKIFSLLLAVMMLSTMMVTVSAMENDGAVTFVPSTTDVKVGDTFTVAVRITGDTDTDVVCLGGSFVLKPSSNVEKGDIVAGDAAAGFATQNIGKTVAKQNINDTNGFSGDGDLLIATYTATEAGTFTLKAQNTKISFKIPGTTSSYNKTSIPELTFEIKEDAPAFTPETVKGAAVEGTDNVVLEKDPANKNFKNQYLGTAVFNATLGAAVNYSEAGFIWVKDEEETANKFTVDASVIAGGGTFEYAVAMYAIPAGVDIDAIPYYVTAE